VLMGSNGFLVKTSKVEAQHGDADG